MEKVDAPEDMIRTCGGNTLFLDPKDDDGWDLNLGHYADEKYIVDAKYDCSYTTSRNRTLTPYPGREDRVRRWIAKGRLLNPNFDISFKERKDD